MKDRPYLYLYLLLGVLGMTLGFAVSRRKSPVKPATDIVARLQAASSISTFTNVYVLEADGTKIQAELIVTNGEEAHMTGAHIWR